MAVTTRYRIPLADGRRLAVESVSADFGPVSSKAFTLTGNAVGLTVSGGGGSSGVTYSGNSTAVVDTILVGADPGPHGLHVEHTHPSRFFGAVTITAIADGPWESAATWDLGRVPEAGDVVRIPTKLTISPAGSRKLTCNLLAVNTTGILECDFSGVGAESSNGFELVFADTEIDTDLDPYQWGQGLIVLGAATIKGVAKTPWVKLATEALAGATTLVFASAVTGWKVGDRVVLPDTRQLPQTATLDNPNHANHLNQGQFDERTVASVAGDGLSVTLDAALTYDHKGARDRLGAIDVSPAVANLTRNVLIRSANPAGTRGHVLSHGRAAVDVRHCEIRDTGRTLTTPFDNTTESGGTVTHVGTNQKGRYGGWHFHHTIGPAGLAADVPQFRFEGNSCWCQSTLGVTPPRWAITVHGSHYGLVKGNVVYNWTGSGVVVENGSETGNVIEGNCVIRVPFYGDGELTRWSDDVAHGGQAYWFGGCANRVIGNVSQSSWKGYSVVCTISTTPDAAKAPAYKGADPHNGGAELLAGYAVNRTPLLEWSGNECGGRLEVGVDFWSIFVEGGVPWPIPGALESVVEGQVIWHVFGSGLFNYNTTRMTWTGAVLRCDFAQIRAGNGFTVGFYFGDYEAKDWRCVGANVQGFPIGALITTVGNYEFEDTVFSNYRDVENRPTFTTLLSAADIHERDLVIRNCTRLDPLCNTSSGLGYKGFLLRDGSIHALYVSRVIRDRCFLYDFGGTPGDDYQVYYPEQAAGATMDATQDPYSGIVRRGTAQGGTANTVTLDAGASGTNNAYNGLYVALSAGTGQTEYPFPLHQVVAYNGATKVATVSPAWRGAAPDATTHFVVNNSGYVRVLGCPESGLTNAQALAAYGVCTAGEITPGGTTTLTGVSGVCKAI